MRIIRNSDIQSYRSCRRAWYFSSMLHMGLEPLRPYEPFFLGRGVHHALGVSITPGSNKNAIEAFRDWFTDALTKIAPEIQVAMQDELAHMLQLGTQMLAHYMLWRPSLPLFTAVPELKLTIPLKALDDVSFSCRLDGIGLYKGTIPVVFDYKTSSRLPDERALLHDEQPTAYLWALNHVPELVQQWGAFDRFIYIFMKKKAPKPPNLVYNGTALSKAQNQPVSYYTYLAAIKRHGFDVAGYADFLSFLKGQVTDWFDIRVIYKSAEAQEQWYEHVVAVAREMFNPRTALLPQPHWFKCPYCIFEQPCAMMEMGCSPEMVEHYMLTSYKKRDTAEEDVSTEIVLQ